ncbi:MAG: Ig domain-containing protein [Balneolaceae bacterium]
MEISGVKAIESSATHLYVLSETEGLVVFRTHSDSLQWLYSSTGMQRRGNKLQADVRFAYLYGDGRRMTIVEPTSVLGVYSATVLSDVPVKTGRIANTLYVVLRNNQVKKISLESPESVDQAHETVNHEALTGKNVIDLITDGNTMLYILTDRNSIELFRHDPNARSLKHQQSVQIDRQTSTIFFTDKDIFGADSNGAVFSIDSNGRSRVIASIEEPVDKLDIWNDNLIIRSLEGNLWFVQKNGETIKWKDNPAAGNYFAIDNQMLWISDFDQIFPVRTMNEESTETKAAGDFNKVTLKPIPDITVPFPKTVIIPLDIEENFPAEELGFSYRSTINNASIRGHSFYWQPTATQTGRHNVTIVVQTAKGLIDSTSFTIDLRSFNAPPRFTPQRPITIPANEPFELQITAIDPDGVNPNLIRYLGVDLPEGASLDEQTGRFTWTPSLRHVRKWEFQVIATDQFGAATSQNIEINVVEMGSVESGNVN